MADPVETSELLAFAKTVESKSLSRAAAELGVPRATISRRLGRLEQRLGARLLRRTTRSLVLTDAGEALYRHARIVLDAVAQAEASVRRTDEAVRGDLRVSVPPMMSPSFFALLCDFAAQHPQLRLHVHFSAELVDLRRGGFDVALRASSELEPGLIARHLARDAMMAVASPVYLARHGTPRTLRDLRSHRCLMALVRGELPSTHWPATGGGKIHVEGAFFSNEVTLLCEAALQGLGIALLPHMIAGPRLETGALVQVLPGVIGAQANVAAVYPEREFVPPQVRAFVAVLVDWAAKELATLKPPAIARQRRPVATRDRARPGRAKKKAPRKTRRSA